jgi:hypothetical protein
MDFNKPVADIQSIPSGAIPNVAKVQRETKDHPRREQHPEQERQSDSVEISSSLEEQSPARPAKGTTQVQPVSKEAIDLKGKKIDVVVQ